MYYVTSTMYGAKETTFGANWDPFSDFYPSV